MVDIHSLTEEGFNALPLVIEGESKEVRYAGEGLVVIRFKPTIYSFTANRCGVVAGSDVLRLKATRRFLEVLRKADIKHVYREVTDKWVLAELVMPTKVEFDKYKLPVFVPDDIDVSTLITAPPIEVIVKRFHGGTSKHRYKGMGESSIRASHPLYAGVKITAEEPYPCPIVRFDWRNPFKDDKGKNIADEALPTSIADWYLDTKKAELTAHRMYEALGDFLGDRDIVMNDVCFFIAEDGETVYGEVSQDCGRFRHFDLGSLDKDVWRAGGSGAVVLEKWQVLLDCIEG